MLSLKANWQCALGTKSAPTTAANQNQTQRSMGGDTDQIAVTDKSEVLATSGPILKDGRQEVATRGETQPGQRETHRV
jgi:hypothetical protein